MKIKIDFVTNSSSSSFVVMGCTVNKKEIIDANIELIKEKLFISDSDESDYDIESVSIYDIDFVFKDTGLSYSSYPYEDYEIMIGHCYTNMNDDETMAQFKKRCKDDIEKLIKKEVQVHHIEESWMDG